jgi:hypothetical protein
MATVNHSGVFNNSKQCSQWGGNVDTSDQTMSVVRAYHSGWTTKQFSDATDLLSPSLIVEVPINEYPTTESFARAVASFGTMVNKVTVLAEFVEGDEAMLLYDMDVDGLGALRIAEHFTVAGGKITKIRQVHDTAPIRAAGFSQD